MKLVIDRCAMCGCKKMVIDEIELDGGDLYCAFVCTNCNKGHIDKATIEYT